VTSAKDDFSAFRFDRSGLALARQPGISAIMRIKNGAEFLRLSIESHLRYFDEIVACFNDCSDETPNILAELADRYPGKVRPIEYLPKVHPILSAEHAATPTDSLHATANYYNFALSQARYSYATKLDDDHLAIDVHVEAAMQRVREAIRDGRREIYTFSGLNLARNAKGQLGVYTAKPFVGSGDHLYFPVCEQIYFVQEQRTEIFHFLPPRLPKRYVGLLYFHLKHAKAVSGFHNLATSQAEQSQLEYERQFSWATFDEFSSSEQICRLRKAVNPFEYWLRTNRVTETIIHSISGRNPPLKIARLARLADDLSAIDFRRDVLVRID
jgi:glycosyltransferase involved in cell wall biosynthesis